VNGSGRARFDRRTLLAALGGGAVALGVPLATRAAVGAERLSKPIPASGERLPVIGMGSWITFNVEAEHDIDRRHRVLQAFFDHGGGMIDSSPMYGSSEAVIGAGLARFGSSGTLFAATKVWLYGRRDGIRQMERSRELWGIERFDLMQVHNLLDWQTHYPTLSEWKAAGRIRYLGVTTSHGRRHAELERIMVERPLDFVQLTYNVVDHAAEQRLLPLAAERGIAVIVNRPFRGGALFRRVGGRPLPGWAAQFDCTNWAQFFLKFCVSHPAVTCAIPATSKVAHLAENMGAGVGRLPNPETRLRMARLVAEL